MGTPPDLLRDAREHAGLSARALAARAGVPTTTITRVESGATDPTVGMLTRLLGAAGFDLRLTSSERPGIPVTLASLATAVVQRDDRLRIDWTRLRAFADWTHQHPAEVRAVIADPPRRTGTAFDALLAGLAELLADRAGIPAPPWTRAVPTPSEPWSPPGTPAMHARAQAATPPAFRRRNIILSGSAIFRDAA